MWLYTPEFFVSVVDNREGYPQGMREYHLTARFRREDHANAFADLAFAYLSAVDDDASPAWHLGPIVHTPDRDYQYRLVISRDLLAQTLTGFVQQRLLYKNFKDAVDDALAHHTYGQVWGVTNQLADT